MGHFWPKTRSLGLEMEKYWLHSRECFLLNRHENISECLS